MRVGGGRAASAGEPAVPVLGTFTALALDELQARDLGEAEPRSVVPSSISIIADGSSAQAALAASWPQAAAMSRPRVRRTVAGTPRRTSSARKRSIASRSDPL